MTGDRLDELAAAWSTDDPDPALRAELEALLRRDSAARRRFLDHCVAEMAMVDCLVNSSGNTQQSGQRTVSRRSPRRPSRPSKRIPMVWWATGAAAVLLIAVLCIPGGKAIRVNAGALVVDGRSIPRGNTVTLPLRQVAAGPEGAELNDPAGITLVAGPGTGFTISAPGRIELFSGQLTLDVDSGRAPPTSVRTDELVASVVGTRFRVVRSDGRSAVEVERGTVQVATLDRQIQAVSAGMQVVADAKGFIDQQPPASTLKQLLYLTEDLVEVSIQTLDQPIRIPAGRPFTLRAEVDPAVSAVKFHLEGTPSRTKHPRVIELGRPFDLWGDSDKQPDFAALPVGTFRLTIAFFAKGTDTTPLETREFTLIAE